MNLFWHARDIGNLLESLESSLTPNFAPDIGCQRDVKLEVILKLTSFYKYNNALKKKHSTI